LVELMAESDIQQRVPVHSATEIPTTLVYNGGDFRE